MSSAEHSGRKRQSGQAAAILPDASTATDGSGGALSPRASTNRSSEICCSGENEAPPSVERVASTAFCASEIATITSVPSGSTTGCAPKPAAVAATGADQVSPPSRETWEAMPPFAMFVHWR